MTAALQFSVAVRNAQLDALEVAVGTSPNLQLRTGSAPAACSNANTGTLLCELALPSNWLANASAGVKSLAGTWTGIAVANGQAAHWRIFNTADSTCHVQGNFIPDFAIAIADTVNVTGYDLTGGNA